MTMIRGTKEWAVAEINCSTGCPHECLYCYARTKALKNNIIASAGIDVFEKEPPESTNPLITNKKVVLSPHSATFTKEGLESMAVETAQNIIDFFENKIENTKIVKL